MGSGPSASKRRTPAAEEHRGHAHLDLVDLARVEQLLRHVGAAHRHRPVARNLLGERERVLHTVGHERHLRAPFTVGRSLVGDDEDRRVDGMTVLPAVGDVERAAAADHGARPGHPFVDHDLARVRAA